MTVAPAGFTVAQFTAKARAMTGQSSDGYSTRQAAYDLRKLRGKQLVTKPGRTRRYHVSMPTPPAPSRRCSPSATRSSRPSSPESVHHDAAARPTPWTQIDRDYETLRLDMQTLFNDLGISTKPAPA